MAGLYYEELTPGLVIEHSTRRTVSEYDNILFSAITHNVAPLHLDEEYAKTSIYGRRIMNSMYTLGLVCGVIVAELTQGTTMGNLGFEQVKFPNPLFPGDTVKVRTEVVARRESKKYPQAGIVTFKHIGLNQHDVLVCECTRIGMMLKKPAGEAQAARA